ncbi:hypothetical protein Afil01_43370 [Actinorhabdospora filicis]|uniref:SUKH superfamily protein n=1 Tax=Actinorhabdospora filicis TaxID=1785913 RepID=A0A9W6SPA6_9ACTN|nr:hypothetical protein [Actinorhabdospora filicis]GLZ79530.1 hypothetical protein Afil01_43370 [Actinorhabdospora filicis]
MGVEDALASLRAKMDRVTGLTVRGATVARPASGVEDVDGLPEGVGEVYRIIGHLEGSYFRFPTPSSIVSQEAWESRPVDDEDPMGNPVEIGFEILGAPPEIDGAPIRMDANDGGVYWLDPDDYVFLWENPDEDVAIEDFAPSLAEFLDAFVLGPRYPELVRTVLGDDALERAPKSDAWFTLLTEAGLLGSPEENA